MIPRSKIMIVLVSLLCLCERKVEAKRGQWRPINIGIPFRPARPIAVPATPPAAVPTTAAPTTTGPTTESTTTTRQCTPGPVMGCVTGMSTAMCDATPECPAGQPAADYVMCYEFRVCPTDATVPMCSCDNA